MGRPRTPATPHVDGYPVGISSYNNRRCRCSGCRAAKAKEQREYQARRRGQALPGSRDARADHRERSDRERVEIALARGVSALHIMAIWDLTYEQLKTIVDEMAG